MLKDHKLHTTIPCADLERAKRFYTDKLGLKAGFEGPGGAFFEAGQGTRLALYPTPNTERGGHTQLGFAVDDIDKEVAELRSRGVVFEEYDFPGLKTENGIATTSDGKASWFKDTEGNTIGLVQLAGD